MVIGEDLRKQTTANRNIRLVVCDLDGTLIGRDEILTEKAIALAKKLQSSNIMFSLATGRVDYLVTPYIQSLGIGLPVITCNGAAVLLNSKVLYRRQIPVKELYPIFKQADTLGFSIIYSIDGYEFVWRTTPWILREQTMFDRYHEIRTFTQDDWQNLFVDKVTIIGDGGAGQIDQVETLCLGLSDTYTFTKYADRAVEIVEKTANKAIGLEFLVNYLGICIDEVMVVGDHQNDVRMIAEAGLGIAVANATPETKCAADYICRLDGIDGVIEAIEHFWDRLVPSSKREII